MSNAVAIRQDGAVADYKPKGMLEIAQAAAIMQQLIAAVMKDGVHYGKIPGTDKKTLFKPGSEKILSTFRISVDTETEDLSTEDYIRYRVKTIGRLPDGTVVGFGIGECSSDEEKYKWRKIVHQKEWDATAPTMRREKIYKNGEGQKQVRVNPSDVANTILKMAKKRSQIDLTLTTTAASDVFEQDLEDLADVIDITEYQKPTGGKPEVKPPQSTQQSGDAPAEKDPAAKIAPGGAAYLAKQLEAKRIPVADFCAHMGVAALADITNGQFNAACGAAKKWEAQP